VLTDEALFGIGRAISPILQTMRQLLLATTIYKPFLPVFLPAGR